SPFDGGTQGSREYALLNVIGKEARKSPNAAALLSEMESGLSLEQRSFAWGVLGHYQSQSLNVPAALDYYGKVADRRQLTDDQIEWYARAALRARRWDELASVISHMPEKLQKSPTWLYWLARSRAATGNTQEAEKLYKQAAATGRN
ncbi:lytic transglycosylase domain-containing protein, partial [Enterobacter hormaechei subsp. steigerwaltii]|nr:lytic transglycosylase domain-containing protein [Enterobacter hormaechei subsp. steigerwaltii]